LDAAVSLCRSISCAIPAKIFYLKQLHARYSEQNTYRVPCHRCPILAFFWLGWEFVGSLVFKDRGRSPQARSPSRLHSEERAFAAPETDSSLFILLCGYMWGRGENAFRRTKVTTIHTGRVVIDYPAGPVCEMWNNRVLLSGKWFGADS